MDKLTDDRRLDHLGLQSPFSSQSGTAVFEEGPWTEGEGPLLWSPQSWMKGALGVVGAALAKTDDPDGLEDMLKIPGRFDDPLRNASVEMDGTRFSDFLIGRRRRDFAASWLSSRPALAAAAQQPKADLGSGDITKAWFVIHDVGRSASVKDGNFYTAAKYQADRSVHGYLNWSGSYAAVQDFDKRASGTVFEFLAQQGRKIAYGKTINIETVPDIEWVKANKDGSLPPATDADRYASIGYIAIGKKAVAKDPLKRTHVYYKWTKESFDTLADLYILASARAGHLLTVTAHKEMDRNLAISVLWNEPGARARLLAAGPTLNCHVRPKGNQHIASARDCPGNYHGDPYGFDMQALYDVITAKLNALGGRQMPAGARYGINPRRLRLASGLDVMNGDSQLHEFPHQSGERVQPIGKRKEKGWWNTISSKEVSDEAPWSQNEWAEAAEAADAGEWETVNLEDADSGSLMLHENGDPNQEEQMAWLDSEERSGTCATCGANETWQSEGWGDQEGAFGGGGLFESPDMEGSGDYSNEVDLMAEADSEADYELPRGQSSPFALVRAIPDTADFAPHVPLEYRLNAKEIVGKLSSDLQKLKAPDAKEIIDFGKDIWEFIGGGSPVGLMGNLLVGVLKNIPGGYLALGAEIAEQWATRGFARGVALGAGRRSKAYLKQTYGHDRMPDYRESANGKKIAASNYGAGLVAGYIQGRALTKNQHVIFWKDLRSRMGSQTWRGARDRWGERDWQEWYSDCATAFTRYHL